MDNKVALITGGAKGIGRAVALDLATQGWKVAICYRTSAQEATEVIDGVKQTGSSGMALQCDVSKAEAAVRLVERVHQEFGRIDALINGAGPYHRVSLLQETNTGWHEHVRQQPPSGFLLDPGSRADYESAEVGAHRVLHHGQR